MECDREFVSRYPHLKFRKSWGLEVETQYLLGACDAMVGAMCQIPIQPESSRSLLHVSLVKGAQATTAIEGNTLTAVEVEKVSVGEPLARSKEYQAREVRNILDAMNDILQSVAVDGQGSLITPELVKRFHKAVGTELGEHFDAIPGQFRTDERTVGPYRCPRGEDVDQLMRCLCQWLKTEFGFASNEQTFPQAVVQAIVTHVYLEWIHPFGDGNGRTGRLLEFYILMRGGNPDIASHILSNHYNETRSEYYRQLDQAGKTGDLSAFLKYAIQGYHDGLKAVLTVIAQNSLDTAWRYLIHARFAERPYRKKNVFKRRRRLALALPPDRAVTPDEAMMLTPELAREYAALTVRTLTRDLEELREMGIVLEKDQKFSANVQLLGGHMARRRVAAPAAATVSA